MTILLFAGLLLIARCISISVASADGPRPKNGQNQIGLRCHKTGERS